MLKKETTFFSTVRIAFVIAFIVFLITTPATRPRAQDDLQQTENQEELYRQMKLARLQHQDFACGAIDKDEEKRFNEELLKSEFNRQRLEKQGHFQTLTAETLNQNIGNIAVVEDDGTIVIPPNSFDLNGKTVQLTPNDNNSYRVQAIAFAFDSDAGARITEFTTDLQLPHTPPDDGFAQLSFSQGFSFKFYGTTYTSVFIGTNGFLTFGAGSGDPEESVSSFLSEQPRIAALWHDLDVTPSRLPSADDGIFAKQLADRLVITWKRVPVFNTQQFNTFQIVIFSDGRIILSYNGISASSALVGVSPGNNSGQPNNVDFNAPPNTPLTGAVFERFSNLLQLDIFAATRNFYKTHADDFDFIYLWTDFNYDLGGGAFAFHLGASNTVQGIGRGPFNQTARFGSAGRLQSFLNMNNIVGRYPPQPTDRGIIGLNSALSILGQEQGHRWMSFVRFNDNGAISTELLGRDNAHWSFFFNVESVLSTAEAPRSSSMEGNAWRDNGDGTFSTPSNMLIDYFTPLDLYLMGLYAPEEVPDTFVISNPTNTLFTRSTGPRAGQTVRGTRKNISINQIIQAEGPRIPDHTQSQKEFRAAFLLILRQGTTPAQSTLDKLNLFRTAWESYFKTSTLGRARLTTILITDDTQKPALQINAPAGGEVIEAGVPAVLRWQSSDNVGVKKHTIKLSTDGGLSFPTIIGKALPGSQQQFLWQVPSGLATRQARIQVTARDDVGNKTTVASNNFTISSVPRITSARINQATASKPIRFVVEGSGFITGDAVIEVNGSPFSQTFYPATGALPCGTSVKIQARGAEVTEKLPAGVEVNITVFNRRTSVRSAPFKFRR